MGKEPNTAVSEPKKGIISSVLGFLGRLAVAPGKMLIYPVWPMKVMWSVEVTWPVKFTLPLFAYPENWRKSFDEIWHDFKNGLRGLINSPPEKYDKPIRMSQGTKYFSVIIRSNKKNHEAGIVIFEASKVLTGDIPYLTNEQLKEIEVKLPNISISREKNEIVIEIDVQEIIKEVKKTIDSYGLEVSFQQAKNLAIQGLAEEIDRNFKELAKITGGELKKHTDPKLLWGIAEKLYSKHTEQQEKSAEIVTPIQSSKSSEIVKSLSSKGSSEIVEHMGKELSETMSVSHKGDGDTKKSREFISSARNSSAHSSDGSRTRGF